MTPQEISLFAYNIALLPVMFVSILFLLLTILNIFVDKDEEKRQKRHQKRGALESYPHITVQVPSYNDPVAVRCIEACLKFDYPKGKYDIMILDDSRNGRTQRLLKAFEKKYPGKVSYVHRDNRHGYKPGALKEAMPLVKGEIIVIFDSDFVPSPDFLKRITVPFQDPNVGIVQSRQGFLNGDVNLISRFASYLLMTYHTIVMPINNKMNTVFFCGTAGAIRKSALLKAGGWNIKSITEDSDLSVKILSKGYKNVYLKFETPSEVPVTFEAFIKQQMRWTYGNVRVFFDHASRIIWRKGFTIKQRLMITFITLSGLIAPAVIVMTIAGFSGWFLGDPQLFQTAQLMEFFIKFFYTSGFLIMGFMTFYKRKSLSEFPHLVLAALSISIILSVANTVAIYKALFRKDEPLFSGNRENWPCTPKSGNAAYAKAS